MRAKTIVELLTLSTNLYMISKDEEFMENLTEMMKKGKKKAEDILDEFSEEGEEDKLIQKFLSKAKNAKHELENKIAEIAEKVYAKMNIAHVDQVKKLSDELEGLKRELALAEARIIHLEQKKS